MLNGELLISSYKLHLNRIEVSRKRYRYDGKVKDEEAGLYYYGARYYASWIARFVSVDPLQHDYPIYTPYQYAGNMPITFLDLDGLEPMRNPFDQIQVDFFNSLIPKKASLQKPKSSGHKYTMTKANAAAWPVKGNWKGAGWNVDYGWWGEVRTNKDGSERKHKGSDVNSNLGGNSDLGAPTVATHDGVVQFAKSDYNGLGGAHVYIQTNDKSYRTAYFHLDKVMVNKGDTVKQGQQIGTVGGSGGGERLKYPAHIHYELHEDIMLTGTYSKIDPEIRRGVFKNVQDLVDLKGLTLEKAQTNVELLERRLDKHIKGIQTEENLYKQGMNEGQVGAYYETQMNTLNQIKQELQSAQTKYNKLKQ